MSIIVKILAFAICIVGSFGSELDLTPTPRGLLPKECVHEVPSGSVASMMKHGYIFLETPNGESSFIPPCGHKKRKPQDDGWIVYAEMNGNNFTQFNGTWKVPEAPVVYSNQTVFLFTGLEDTEGDEIIQPVIQYGPSDAGGGGYWTAASWWVTSSGNALFSTLTKCNAEDEIFGYMVSKKAGSWVIGTIINGKTATILTVNNVGVQTFASTTLEAYSISACNQYPANNSTVFTELALIDGNTAPTFDWNSNPEYTNCNEQIETSDNGKTVTILF